jgi:hypothetical protein
MLLESRTRYPLDAAGPHPVAVAARTGPPPPAARDRGRAAARLRRRRRAPAAHAGRRLRHLAGGAADRPRADDRGAQLHALGGAPRYGDTDAELAGEVARRAALALDNARLFAELRRTEGQLEAVLTNLAAAVTRAGARRQRRLRQPGRRRDDGVLVA